MIVSREKIVTKKVSMFSKIILILPINTGRTGAVISSHRRTSGCANRIPPPTRQHACKTSTTDTRYVRGSERQNWPQNTDVNNSNNKRRLCREPSTITISTTFRLCLYQFPPRLKPAVTNEKWAHLSPFITICQTYQSRFPSLNINSSKFYTKIQCVPQQRTIVSPTNTNQLMLFWGITDADCENGMKQGKYTTLAECRALKHDRKF